MAGKNAGKKDGDLKMAENKGMTTLEIIRALSQAASKGYDGALEEDGMLDYNGGNEHQPTKTGLKREDGDPILDRRVVDGFKVKFAGDKLCINYHGEVSLKNIHRNGPKKYEQEIEAMFDDIAGFLKKEYKKTTGNALKLTPGGDADSLIQRMNSVRNWVQSSKWYKIGNIADVKAVDDSDRNLDPHIKTHHDIIRNFLSLSSNKNPKNVTRKQPTRPGLGEVDIG